MMLDDSLKIEDAVQITGDEDGCTYVLSFATGKWYRLCEISIESELPQSVKNKIDMAAQSLEKLAGGVNR